MTTTSRDELNQISDAQWNWAPFKRLRPDKNQPMPSRLIFWTAVTFAAAIVGGKASSDWLFGLGIYTPSLASTFVAYFLVSYLCYSLTFARAWDARAKEVG